MDTTETPTWDRERFERELAWARTQPTHQSHAMKSRQFHGAPDRVCTACGCRDGSIGSRKPCAPTPEMVARRAEMAADRALLESILTARTLARRRAEGRGATQSTREVTAPRMSALC